MLDTREEEELKGFVCFDIETTHLKANFGHILAASVVPLYGPCHIETFRLDDPMYQQSKPYDDSRLVEALAASMEEATCWLGWNNRLFDVPYINTRLVAAGAPPMEKRLQIDLLYAARRPNLALHSARLEAVMDFFDLQSKKSKLDPTAWVRAANLERDAMDYVVRHNVADTKALREVFEYLKPFVRTIHV